MKTTTLLAMLFVVAILTGLALLVEQARGAVVADPVTVTAVEGSTLKFVRTSVPQPARVSIAFCIRYYSPGAGFVDQLYYKNATNDLQFGTLNADATVTWQPKSTPAHY